MIYRITLLGAVLCCTAGGVVAAGLELLQADLANCPTLGSEGVLASVRVKDGRLVGTQGLVKQLRKQQGTRVPYKVRRGGGQQATACMLQRSTVQYSHAGT